MSEPQGSENSREAARTVEAGAPGGRRRETSASPPPPPPTSRCPRVGPTRTAGRAASGPRAASPRRWSRSSSSAAPGSCSTTSRPCAPDRPAMRWRRCARRRPRRPAPRRHRGSSSAPGVAAALGLWLIVLAVTPGPARRAADAPHRTPTYGPDSTGRPPRMVLRDRAMEVAGVQSVRVRMSRRKVDVRALSHFRELDDVTRRPGHRPRRRPQRTGPGPPARPVVHVRAARTKKG